jgi:hypothetical protein
MRLILLFILLLPINHIFSQNDDPRSYREKQRSGDYFPNVELTDNDNFEFPTNYDISLLLYELSDVSIKNDNFYVNFEAYFTSKQDTIYITDKGRSLRTGVDNLVSFVYPEGDRQYVGLGFSGKKLLNGDSVYVSSLNFEGDLFHKWNLRDFPFDTQELKLKFTTDLDTSYGTLNLGTYQKSRIIFDDIDYLREGYTITDLKISKSYTTGPEYNYPDSFRPSVFDVLTFSIVLTREGNYLFFKLFFGAFLSYIISLLVFLIDQKLFETRITLSLGGIFGAVGNKYFVENSLPEILTLTKADTLNNMIILFIVLNIFIVIAQSTKSINVGIFEKNKTSIISSLLAFISASLIIIYI